MFLVVCVEMDIPKMVTGHRGDSNAHIQWTLVPETCAFTNSTAKASLANCYCYRIENKVAIILCIQVKLEPASGKIETDTK